MLHLASFCGFCVRPVGQSHAFPMAPMYINVELVTLSSSCRQGLHFSNMIHVGKTNIAMFLSQVVNFQLFMHPAESAIVIR
eukprot:c25308_g14_i1 orf=102-344(-)